MEVIKDECISKLDIVRILQKAYAEGRIQAKDGLSSVIDDIQNTDIQPVDRWINVDEALPDNGNEVLVWYEYFRYGEYNCMYQTYGLGRYIQQYDMWSGDDLNGTKVKVLYWQPLPEPKKG